MTFSSLIFLFFFLPITLALYHLGGPRLRNSLLLAASLFFYAWGGIPQLILLLGVILVNHLFGLLLQGLAPGRPRRAGLALGIAANLSLLVYYKYSAFLLGNINALLPQLHLTPAAPQGAQIPLGISFLTFHAVSYLVDVAGGRGPGEKNPLHLALYLALFPKLLSGPILRYSEAAGQLHQRQHRLEDFAAGVEQFILGLGKKILIATPLATMSTHVFGAPIAQFSVGEAWLGILCYSLQIYFDFAGYSDMAIGLGRMFGFRLPENFNHPYTAQSVREFWQRWHISLSRWFRDYLYIPLGGNRHGPWRTYRNLAVVFLLCGLWHGAGWNFIVWGLLHGIFLILERWRLAALLARLPRLLRHGYVLLFLLVSWIFFRSPTLIDACHFLGALLGLGLQPAVHPWILQDMNAQLNWALTAALLFSLPVMPLLRGLRQRFLGSERTASVLLCRTLYGGKLLLLMTVLLLSAMELASGTYTPFIYFQF
ncbi:MAG: hypothetical protein BWK76_12820 [Desulfobulbaceae bacterium A2]|nr:MAG: hypothetical protein BWK76_12820 [Desulfobulbaceae bacterium A2]